MSRFNLRKLCATGMGAALFVVLSLCLQVPVFENYYLCLGYIAMAIFCYFFGPINGMFVGSIGVVLYCLLISGLRGMPGWFVGNLIIGLMVGLTCKLTKRMTNQMVRQIIIIFVVIISTGIGILGAKSIIESLLYAQPFVLRVAKNSFAFIADIIVLSISFPICLAIQPVVYKIFPELRN